MGLTKPGVGFDEKPAQRVRDALEPYAFTERKMFGGICFMVRGHMCCGVDESDIFVRLDEAAAERALRRKHATPFKVGDRTGRGFVRVSGVGIVSKRSLQSWLLPAAEFANVRLPKPKTESTNGNTRRFIRSRFCRPTGPTITR